MKVAFSLLLSALYALTYIVVRFLTSKKNLALFLATIILSFSVKMFTEKDNITNPYSTENNEISSTSKEDLIFVQTKKLSPHVPNSVVIPTKKKKKYQKRKVSIANDYSL